MVKYIILLLAVYSGAMFIGVAGVWLLTVMMDRRSETKRLKFVVLVVYLAIYIAVLLYLGG